MRACLRAAAFIASFTTVNFESTSDTHRLVFHEVNKMKAQRILTLVITVVLVAGLAGFYFWFAGDEPEEIEPEERSATSVTLFDREESEVVEVVFIRGLERTYARPFTDRFGRLQWEYSGGEGFTLLPRHVHDKARPAWILTAMDTAHENAALLDVADFGLANPAIVAEAVFYDGTRNRLHLGSRTADLQFYFLMREGDSAIYLINAVLGERLLYTVGDMLDLALPAMVIDDAEYIRIAVRGAEPIVLGYAGEDFPPSPFVDFLEDVGGEQLIMFAPLEGVPLSHSRFIERIFDPMSFVRLRGLAEFMPEDLADFGLADPALEFVFRTPQQEIHLKFGDTFIRGDEEYIYVMDASRPHVFFTNASDAAMVIETTPMQIAERSLALVSITDVERVTVLGENGDEFFDLTMNHIPGTFEIEPTLNGTPIEPDDARQAFRMVIGLIAEADIESFAPPAAPELTITHHRTDGPNTELRLYNYNANFLAVSIDGGEAVFVTSRRAVERLVGFLER